MNLSTELLESLLFSQEGVDLDFKSEQYRFTGSSADEKGELLKDILAFSNSWRRTDAYILIGVKEVKGGRSEIVGVSEILDDAQIQQFVNSKTQKPINFSYSNCTFEGKNIGLIHIPIQSRPFYLKKDYGKIKKDTVYIRRGSSTDIATIDEISKMGTIEVSENHTYPQLETTFFDPKDRTRMPDSIDVHSLVLEVPKAKDIPDYNLPRRDSPFGVHIPDMESANHSYYRELAIYIKKYHFFTDIYFAISNVGRVVANDVRLELNISDPQGLITFMPEDEMPNSPRKSYSRLESLYHSVPNLASRSTFQVSKIGDQWLVEFDAGKIQSKSSAWISCCLYFGSIKAGTYEIEAKCFSDELPQPTHKIMKLVAEVEHRKVSLTEVEEMESSRFRSSDEHRIFLEKHFGE